MGFLTGEDEQDIISDSECSGLSKKTCALHYIKNLTLLTKNWHCGFLHFSTTEKNKRTWIQFEVWKFWIHSGPYRLTTLD